MARARGAILHNSADEFVLGADGSIGTPRIVILTAPGRVVFATIIRFGGVRARVAWAGVAPIHRAVVRYLLDRMASLDTAGERP